MYCMDGHDKRRLLLTLSASKVDSAVRFSSILLTGSRRAEAVAAVLAMEAAVWTYGWCRLEGGQTDKLS